MTVQSKVQNKMEFIMAQVKSAQQFKRDEILDFASVRMNERGLLSTLDTSLENYRMTDWASNQLCQKIGIPYRYFEACPPELQQTNVNHWLERAESKNMMFRLRNQGQDKVIRGILSDSYTKYDNHEILELVENYLDKVNQEYDINMWRQDDDGFHLRLTFDALTTSIGYTPDGQEDIHKVGIHVMNSEVGRSAVRIIPMVYRLVCTNGLMAWTTDGNIFSQRHIYIPVETMEERVAVAIGDALKMGDYTLDILKKAKQKKVDNPYEIIEKLAKDKKYSKKFTEKVKDKYGEENDGQQKSLFYVIQAFTNASRDLKEDARIDVERDAATLLEMVEKVA